MISKIELKKMSNNGNQSFIAVDLQAQSILYQKNDTMIKNEKLNMNIDEMDTFIKNYITYWDEEYINNMIIDGDEIELTFFTNDEKFTYHFKNKYPKNYHYFIEGFKEMVDIYE